MASPAFAAALLLLAVSVDRALGAEAAAAAVEEAMAFVAGQGAVCATVISDVRASDDSRSGS